MLKEKELPAPPCSCSSPKPSVNPLASSVMAEVNEVLSPPCREEEVALGPLVSCGPWLSGVLVTTMFQLGLVRSTLLPWKSATCSEAVQVPSSPMLKYASLKKPVKSP